MWTAAKGKLTGKAIQVHRILLTAPTLTAARRLSVLKAFLFIFFT